MAINWDPSNKGVTSPERATPSESSEAESASQAKAPPQGEEGKTPKAMEKPRLLPTPDTARTHPARPGPSAKTFALKEQIAQLQKAIRLGGPEQLQAAKQALALCASYAMRRSKGLRRMAGELVEDVEENVDELSELASRLGAILSAEGDLDETTAQATLRACRALVGLLEEDEEETAP